MHINDACAELLELLDGSQSGLLDFGIQARAIKLARNADAQTFEWLRLIGVIREILSQ